MRIFDSFTVTASLKDSIIQEDYESKFYNFAENLPEAVWEAVRWTADIVEVKCGNQVSSRSSTDYEFTVRVPLEDINWTILPKIEE